MNYFRLLLILAGTLLVPGLLFGHGFEGERFFPPTMTIDDPFAVDDLALPTVTILHVPGDQSLTREIDIGAEFDKEIFPKFEIGIQGTYTNLTPRVGPSVDGFQDFTLLTKYQLLEAPEHEFLFSVGGEWEMGGTGRARVGANSFSTFSPAIYFGKGFGELPEAVSFLRPLALTGVAKQSIPTEAQPNVLSWGFALEYSLPYLETQVKDTGLPHPFRDMIPLVELSIQSPENRGGGEATGTINPGVLYESRYFQLGAEFVIPVNKETGRNLGFLIGAHIYIDDLLPKLFGHPIFGTREAAR